MTILLEEALALALRLAPEERLQLIERVALSVQQDMRAEASSAEGAEYRAEDHWGKSLNRLMDEIGPIEMKYPDIEDAVEWVKHLRAEARRRRLGDWGEETLSDADDTK